MDELQEIDAKTNVLGYSKRGKHAMCINQAVLAESKTHGHFIANCEKITRQKKCLYLNNYYRKRQVKHDLIEPLIVFPMTAEQVKEESTFAECCPAAVSNELLKRAEVIACSYLYMFDRELRIKFLQTINLRMDQIVLIIDEAHNLPNTVSDINEQHITSKQVAGILLGIRGLQRIEEIKNLIPMLSSLHLFLTNYSKDLQNYAPQALVGEDEFVVRLGNLFMAEDPDEIIEDLLLMKHTYKQASEVIRWKIELKSDIYKVLDFLMELARVAAAKGYQSFLTKKGKEVDFGLHLFDPGIFIKSIISAVHISISASGSLGKPSYFKMQFGSNLFDHE
ncbi:MAG: hypothetical protein IH840_07455, partial [Candidatus Heimdallarchaeota archaeon]|nr:hypothetical protein [Candidatus Heimdallarchaeota archaeon]